MHFKNKSFFKGLAGFMSATLLTALSTGCDSTGTEPEVLPPITPLPQPEMPDEPEDNYDETKILNYVKELSWWDSVEAMPMVSADRKFERGVRVVKLASDADYIYGYVEVNTIERDKWETNTSLLNNLGVWVDSDGVSEGQGGGWFLCYHKGYETLLRGSCAVSYEPKAWSPTASDVKGGGDNFGTSITSMEEWRNIGVGSGKLEGDIFKYTFTIDRTRLGLKDKSEIWLGITFDAGGFNDFAIIPDRAGFQFNLVTGTGVGTDENKILNHVRSFSDWDNVTVTECPESQNNKASSIVKFDSDKDYIYGYFEVPNTDNLVLKEASDYTFGPGFLRRLAIGLDIDGVETGQGIGWPVGNNYEMVLYGDVSSYTIDFSEASNPAGWRNEWSHARILAANYDPATTKVPGYKITPSRWNPEIRDCTSAGWGTVRPGTEEWSNVATGTGDWTDWKFRYSYTIDRSRLGLSGLSEIKLGVMFHHTNVDGYSVVPNAKGFTLKLNN